MRFRMLVIGFYDYRLHDDWTPPVDKTLLYRFGCKRRLMHNVFLVRSYRISADNVTACRCGRALISERVSKRIFNFDRSRLSMSPMPP